MKRPFFLPTLIVALLLIGSCVGEDVGAGIDVLSTTTYREYLVYYAPESADENSGRPMYAGQALVYEGCARSICHSSVATDRVGVPAGLDFDLLPCDAGDDACTDELVAGIHARQDVVFEWRDEIYGTMQRGSMPPGDAGESRLRDSDFYFEISADGVGAADTRLPRADTAEARELIRAWLASGAPTISQWSPSATDPAASCETEVVDWPRCVRGQAVATTPSDPTWPAIYRDVVQAQTCADGTTCHGSGSEIGIEFISEESMYRLFCGEGDTCGTVMSASGGDCAGDAIPYITAGDATQSLFWRKLHGATPQVSEESREIEAETCGDPMGDGDNGAGDRAITAVRAWIEAGALRN